MEPPKDTTGAVVPSKLSPELLQPLVTVVATLGLLGAPSGGILLAGGSLRSGLVALSNRVHRAMEHGHGEPTLLRHRLATAAAAAAATVTRQWREAVAKVEATWATAAEDVARLRDACGTVATAATSSTSRGDVEAAIAREDKACCELLVAARALPVATDLAMVDEKVQRHEAWVAEASAGLEAASEATKKVAEAMKEPVEPEERRQWAVVAQEQLGSLLAACHGAASFYGHLRGHLEDIEATVATLGGGGPQAPEVAPGGVPEALKAALVVPEVLWTASARLAKGHLLRAVRLARDVLVNPDATKAAAVTQHCQEATAALPALLAPQPW